MMMDEQAVNPDSEKSDPPFEVTNETPEDGMSSDLEYQVWYSRLNREWPNRLSLVTQLDNLDDLHKKATQYAEQFLFQARAVMGLSKTMQVLAALTATGAVASAIITAIPNGDVIWKWLLGSSAAFAAIGPIVRLDSIANHSYEKANKWRGIQSLINNTLSDSVPHQYYIDNTLSELGEKLDLQKPIERQVWEPRIDETIERSRTLISQIRQANREVRRISEETGMAVPGSGNYVVLRHSPEDEAIQDYMFRASELREEEQQPKTTKLITDFAEIIFKVLKATAGV